MKEKIIFSEIVWPYRPDLLIRIDFLQWFQEVKGDYFGEDLDPWSKEGILGNTEFFKDAKMHPYFLQFTRKRRYRKLNLPKSKSEQVYAQGIASFLNLLRSIKKNGFDKNFKIGLRKAIVIKKPSYGEKIKRKYYMADGCHRLACVVWLNKENILSNELFEIQHKLILRPVNSFGIFRRLKIFNKQDEAEFNHLFINGDQISWKLILGWARKISEKFKTVDIDELFKIKFYE